MRNTMTDPRRILWNEEPQGVRAPYPKGEAIHRERVSRDT